MKSITVLLALLLALGATSCSSRQLSVEDYLLLELRGQEGLIGGLAHDKFRGRRAFIDGEWCSVNVNREDELLVWDSLRGVLYPPALRPLDLKSKERDGLIDAAKLGYFIGVNGHSMTSPRDQEPLTREQVLRWVRPEHCCAFEIGWSLAWRDFRKPGPAILPVNQ